MRTYVYVYIQVVNKKEPDSVKLRNSGYPEF